MKKFSLLPILYVLLLVLLIRGSVKPIQDLITGLWDSATIIALVVQAFGFMIFIGLAVNSFSTKNIVENFLRFGIIGQGLAMAAQSINRNILGDIGLISATIGVVIALAITLMLLNFLKEKSAK